ncbi:MAG: 50S ribosomal protein L25 [Dehalococcoidales bacterium]
MKSLQLKANRREMLGKKTRFLRRQGTTPTHLFGHKIESLALECQTVELADIVGQAGMTRLIDLSIGGDKQPKKVIIREIQRNSISRQLLHVDFFQIKLTEKMKAEIPIILVGEAPALKEKGRIISQSLTHLGVESLPDKLPPQIEIDLSPLTEMGNSIHVSDIVLDPAVTITTDPARLVVKIAEAAIARVEKEEAEAEEEELTAEEAEAKAKAEAEAPSEGAETA